MQPSRLTNLWHNLCEDARLLFKILRSPAYFLPTISTQRTMSDRLVGEKQVWFTRLRRNISHVD